MIEYLDENTIKTEVEGCNFDYNFSKAKMEIFLPIRILPKIDVSYNIKNKIPFDLINIYFQYDTGANVTCINYDDVEMFLKYSIKDYDFKLLSVANGFQGNSVKFTCLVPIRVETLSIGSIFEFKKFLLYSGFEFILL